MEQTNRKNCLDDVIKADFKLVNGELGGACALAALIPFILVTFYMAVLIVPAGIGIFYCLAKVCQKLFYDSVFGKSAGLYQALPVSHSDRVISKIFTAAVCQMIPLAVMVVSFFLANILLGNNPLDGTNLFTDIVNGLIEEGMAAMEISVTLSAALLLIIASLLTFVSAVFCAVTFYQSQPDTRHAGIRKAGIIAVAWLVLQVSSKGIIWIFDILKVDAPMLELGLDLLLQIVILIVTFKLTVGMLEKHYQKG